MSDDQFTKLFRYMEKRFDEIDRRFVEVDNRFDKIDARLDEQEWTTLKLYQHVEQRFEKVQAELRSDINRIYDLVDADLKRRETDEQERLAMSRQLDRHEHWIVRTAEHLELNYER